MTMHPTVLSKQNGFTIVELLIATSLGLLLIAVMLNMFGSSRTTFADISFKSRLQENHRIATDLVASAIRRAGYYGGNSDIDTIQGSLGLIPSTPICTLNSNEWGRMLTQPIFGLNDQAKSYACISEFSFLRGDVLVIRHASPWTVSNYEADRLYLRSSLFEGAVFQGKHEASNIIYDQPQSTRELLSMAFYIGNTGRQCQGESVPGLFRIFLNEKGHPVSQELVAGVEHFQFQVLESGQYKNPDKVTHWSDIQSIKFWLLIRSQCKDSSIQDQQTYQLGDIQYSVDDHFHRELVELVTHVRNKQL